VTAKDPEKLLSRGMQFVPRAGLVSLLQTSEEGEGETGNHSLTSSYCFESFGECASAENS